MLKKNVAAVLAIFFGAFGVHEFYLGNQGKGFAAIFMLFGVIFLNVMSGVFLFELLTGFLFIIPFAIGVSWLVMPEVLWREKYGGKYAETELSATLTPAPAPDAAFRDSAPLRAEGVRYYKSGDYDLAAEAFEEAVTVDPTDNRAYFNLACTLSQLGRTVGALDALEKAVNFGFRDTVKIDDHPALAGVRATDAYRRFRDNNYRRVDLRLNETPLPGVQPGTHGDLLEQLNRLRELHNAGILNSEEFEVQRQKLMG